MALLTCVFAVARATTSCSAISATYREIACLVSAPSSSAVVVAAAPNTLWGEQATLPERAVSSFAA